MDISDRYILILSDMLSIQCEAKPFDSVQLVQTSPITMVYGFYNELVTGAYKLTNITGGPHIVVAGVNINQQTQRLFYHFSPTCKKH